MAVTHSDLALVVKIAARLNRRGPTFYEHDDIVSDGALTLQKADADWQTKPGLRSRYKGHRETFLAARIRNGMIDGLRHRHGRKRDDFKRQEFEQGMDRLDAADRIFPARSRSDTVGSEDVGFDRLFIEERLAKLPAREREVIIRNVLEGETAQSIAVDLGVNDSRVCQLRAQALKRMNPPSPRVGGYEPSLREVEVLQAIADGLRNEEISLRLGCGEETVKTHIRHLLTKMPARSRTDAVAQGFRRGLVT